MTKKIRRTEIIIETRKLTIIRSHGKSDRVYCRSCQKLVTAFSFEQLAAISQAATAGDFHQVETIHGSLVCVNSLEIKK